MSHTFFSNPLWQKFQDRNITVYRLSDGQHRLRDAHANILLKEFLPGDTRFETLAVNGKRSPKIPTEGAIIILGRPSLFPERICELLGEVHPKLFYRFLSDDPSSIQEYRTIIRCGLPALRKRKRPSGLDPKLLCESFAKQRETKSKLTDNAIVYSGWRAEQPLMLLAGSSTVGTWAAVHYVTKSPLPSTRAIWQQDVQGVICGDVWAEDEAFDDVESDAVELLSPCRFWLEGGSLPPVEGWTRDALQLEKDGGPDGMDLRIVVNGRPVITKARTYVPTLVLLAWLSNRTRIYPEGFYAEITSGEARTALFNFLRIGKDNPIDLGERESVLRDGRTDRIPKLVDSMHLFAESKIGSHICDNLKELTVAIREAGGLACAEENHRAPGNEAKWTFRLVSRELPHFFPTVR